MTIKPDQTPTDEIDWNSNAKTAPSETKDRYYDNWTEASLANTLAGEGSRGMKERAPKRLCESRASDSILSHSQADHVSSLVDQLAVQQSAFLDTFEASELSDGPLPNVGNNLRCSGSDAEYLQLDSIRLKNQFSCTSAAPRTPKRSRQDCRGIKKRRETSVFPSPISQREGASSSSPMGSHLDFDSYQATEKSHSDQKRSESNSANFLELRKMVEKINMKHGVQKKFFILVCDQDESTTASNEDSNASACKQ